MPSPWVVLGGLWLQGLWVCSAVPSLLGGSRRRLGVTVALPTLMLCPWLQGLCKLGSAGGTDFSMKQFAEGSTMKLAKQCRK